MNELILWGGTGQAKVLAEALDPAQYRLAAIVDRRHVPSPVPGVPVLHGEEGLQAFLAKDEARLGWSFAVAIGGWHGGARLDRFAYLAKLGLKPLTIVHPRAFVARNARLGDGAQVLAMAAVCAEAQLGRAVIVNTAASVDHDCRVGDGAHIGPGARLAGEVHIGDRAFIGTGAVILPRIRIGADAIVGAGAVVTRDVPDHSTQAGNPARSIPNR